MESNIRIAIITGITGILGALLGSATTGYFAYEASKIQLDADRIELSSRLAIDILNKNSDVLEKIYSSVNKLHAAQSKEQQTTALLDLASSAAVCSARLSGEAGVICQEMQISANRFARNIDTQYSEKYEDETFDSLEKLSSLMLKRNIELTEMAMSIEK